MNKDFGVVVTGMQSDKYNEQHLATTLYTATGTNTGSSFSNPFLQQFTLQDGPRSQSRSNYGIKLDWRPLPNSVLSLNVQHNAYKTWIGTQSPPITSAKSTPLPGKRSFASA